jgi:hypothetical protein
MKILIISIFCFFIFQSCESTDWEDAGLGDGYAQTINTACGIRASIIHGKFDDKKYSKGYSRGAQLASYDISKFGCERWK